MKKANVMEFLEIVLKASQVILTFWAFCIAVTIVASVPVAFVVWLGVFIMRIIT